MEKWEFVDGFNKRYEISNRGRVRSNKGQRKILKLKIDKENYYLVRLSMNNSFKEVRVHRLVGKAFISNMENKPFINHIDGNRLNNNDWNLEWCTPKENCHHARDITMNTTVISLKKFKVLCLDDKSYSKDELLKLLFPNYK